MSGGVSEPVRKNYRQMCISGDGGGGWEESGERIEGRMEGRAHRANPREVTVAANRISVIRGQRSSDHREEGKNKYMNK